MGKEMTQLSAKNRIMLLAKIQSRKLLIKRNKDRIAHLGKHPEEATEDDLDMLVDAGGYARRDLFKQAPEMRDRYEQFRDTPESVTADLMTFVRRAWPHTKIGKPFQENWHQRVFANVIERMSNFEIKQAIFAVPPGTGKSIWHGVFKAAWRWAIDPTERLAYFSYSDMVPSQTGAMLLTLINSPWYRRRWGHKFDIEAEGKEWIRNSRGGWRFGQGVGGGGTGAHPDWMDIDDANKGKDATSQAKKKQVVSWFSNTAASRGVGNDVRLTVTAQRISSDDLIGRILGEHLGVDPEADGQLDLDESMRWHNCCLPMRFNPTHRYRYPDDPRTEKGELLWKERFTEQKVKQMEIRMSLSGEPNVQAQLDQDPLACQSTLFENIDGMWIQTQDLPPRLSQCRAIRAWDRAGTEGGGDWTVGVLMVQVGTGKDMRRYILDVARFQCEPTSRDNRIEKVALADKQRFQEFYRVANERMPGPDGKQVHTNLFAALKRHNIECIACDPTKDKETRARGVAGAVKYSILRVVDGKPWRETLYDEVRLFPNGAHDDIVDAMAHAYNALDQWETKV